MRLPPATSSLLELVVDCEEIERSVSFALLFDFRGSFLGLMPPTSPQNSQNLGTPSSLPTFRRRWRDGGRNLLILQPVGSGM